jgi:hypothetical protein
VPALLALAFLDGSLALTGRALTRGSVAAALRPHGQLGAGNALLNLVFGACFALSPALGGLCLALLDVTASLLACAGLFCLMALLLAGAPHLAAAPAEEGAGRRGRDGVRVALRHLREHPALARLVVAQATALMLAVVITPIEAIYATETLGAGTRECAAWGRRGCCPSDSGSPPPG